MQKPCVGMVLPRNRENASEAGEDRQGEVKRGELSAGL